MEVVAAVVTCLVISLIIWRLISSPASKESTTVEAEVVPQPHRYQQPIIPSQGVFPSPDGGCEKEITPLTPDPDTIPFTIDLKALIRTALNDPHCRREIYAAIREGVGAPTEVLGAANLGEKDGPDEWFSLFLSIDRETEPGKAGFVRRNRTGNRVSARLRRQVRKDHAAQTQHSPALSGHYRGQVSLLTEAFLEGNPEAARSLRNLSTPPDDDGTPSL